jgi:hypothetical protein
MNQISFSTCHSLSDIFAMPFSLQNVSDGRPLDQGLKSHPERSSKPNA